jgi:hypothetical protein
LGPKLLAGFDGRADELLGNFTLTWQRPVEAVYGHPAGWHIGARRAQAPIHTFTPLLIGVLMLAARTLLVARTVPAARLAVVLAVALSALYPCSAQHGRVCPVRFLLSRRTNGEAG